MPDIVPMGVEPIAIEHPSTVGMLSRVVPATLGYFAARLLITGVERTFFEDRLEARKELYRSLRDSVSSFDTSESEPDKNTKSSNLDSIHKTNEYIKDAVSKLEAASDTTNCAICKTKLKDAAENVKSETEFILVASNKYEAMQKLFDRGAIESNRWGELTSIEKELVNAEVGE